MFHKGLFELKSYPSCFEKSKGIESVQSKEKIVNKMS